MNNPSKRQANLYGFIRGDEEMNEKYKRIIM
jgi:hypothetical protein